MSGELVVRSKLIGPHLPRSMLLSERIRNLALAICNSRATVVTAPAGYGKTTLLAAALAPDVYQKHRVCWYRLEQEDSDLAVFYSHLTETLFPCHDRSWMEARVSLARFGNIQEQYPYVNAVICQELWASYERHSDLRTFIVLDDFQHAAGVPEIASAVRYLIDNLPENCSVIVSSRCGTDLLEGRQRLQPGVLEIGRDALLFSTGELDALLGDIYRIEAAPDLKKQIMGNTEGWIAGIIMICQVLERHTAAETADLIRRGGDKEPLFAYLTAEVLRTAGRKLISFLVKAAILRDFTAACAGSILEEPEAAELLAQCEQKGLFIQETAGQETIYSFHPLFQEALHQALPGYLSAAEVSRYHLRAADNYIGQQFFIRAIEHFIAAGSVDLAVDLVTRESAKLTTLETMDQLRLWFKLLPDPVVSANGHLLYIKAWLTGDGSYELLSQALAKFQEQNDAVMQVKSLLYLIQISAIRNDVPSIIKYLNQKPIKSKESGHPYLAMCLPVLDLIRFFWDEQYTRGTRLINDISRLELDGDWRFMATSYSCLLHCMLGDLDLAEYFIKETLRLDVVKRMASLGRGYGLVFYAIVQSLKGNFTEFSQLSIELTAIGEQYSSFYVLGQVKRLSALNSYSGLDMESALDQIDASTGHFEQMKNIAYPSLNRLSRCLWLTRQRDAGSLLAEAKAAFKTLSANRTGMCLREIGQSLLGAVAREAGDHEFAEECLLSSIAGSRKKGARQVLCGSLFHLAKLYWDSGDEARGRDMLGQAMEIAISNRYVTFWDLHLPTLVEMAVRCVREGICPEYALELITRYYGKEAADYLAANAPAAGGTSLQEFAAAFETHYGAGAAVEGHNEAPKPRIGVRLLGRFTIDVNGTIIPGTAWKTKKIAGILKYLLLHRNRNVTRDRLMGVFWPDSEQHAASISLRVSLYELRKTLSRYGVPVAGGAALIRDRRGGLEIRTGSALSLDVDQFVSLYDVLHPPAASAVVPGCGASKDTVDQARMTALEQMMTLYQGDLLEGDECLDWVSLDREKLMAQFTESALSLASIYKDLGEHKKAEEFLIRALDTDRYNEEACLHLLRLYAATNRRGRAAKLYVDFTRRLQKELGIQPDARLAEAVTETGS